MNDALLLAKPKTVLGPTSLSGSHYDQAERSFRLLKDIVNHILPVMTETFSTLNEDA
jgi:hypothetical protein